MDFSINLVKMYYIWYFEYTIGYALILCSHHHSSVVPCTIYLLLLPVWLIIIVLDMFHDQYLCYSFLVGFAFCLHVELWLHWQPSFFFWITSMGIEPLTPPILNPNASQHYHYATRLLALAVVALCTFSNARSPFGTPAFDSQFFFYFALPYWTCFIHKSYKE